MTERKTILVVEDDRDVRETVTVVLEELYRVEEASNGREALELIGRRGLPDLILLDMRMPVMDGWRFAAELRARYGSTAPPIVVMTAASDASSRAAEVHANGCLEKPFDIDRLLSVVRTFLALSCPSVD